MMDALFAADLGIVQWVAENLHTPFLDKLMVFITSLGDRGFIWIAITLLLLMFKRTRHFGAYCAVSLMMAHFLGEGSTKLIVGRLRPFYYENAPALLIAPPNGFSFPSGHSASSFAMATAIFKMDRRYGIAAYVLAALIAFSRLYLSVHFLSDILVGAALGTVCALGAYRLMKPSPLGGK